MHRIDRLHGVGRRFLTSLMKVPALARALDAPCALDLVVELRLGRPLPPLTLLYVVALVDHHVVALKLHLRRRGQGNEALDKVGVGGRPPWPSSWSPVLLTRRRLTTEVMPVLVLPRKVHTQCCFWLVEGMLPFLSTSTRKSWLKRAMMGVHTVSNCRCTSGAKEILFELRRGKTQTAGVEAPSCGLTTHLFGTGRKTGTTLDVSFHGPPSWSSYCLGVVPEVLYGESATVRSGEPVAAGR